LRSSHSNAIKQINTTQLQHMMAASPYQPATSQEATSNMI
jgi:hypothetical protein